MIHYFNITKHGWTDGQTGSIGRVKHEIDGCDL